MISLLGKLIEFHLIKLSPATEQTKQGQENATSSSLWPVEVGDPCLCSYHGETANKVAFCRCYIVVLYTDTCVLELMWELPAILCNHKIPTNNLEGKCLHQNSQLCAI